MSLDATIQILKYTMHYYFKMKLGNQSILVETKLTLLNVITLWDVLAVRHIFG